jgi:TetR/AcrR family transcriptional repressor of nem operon
MPPRKDARNKLLDSAMTVFRTNGYAASSVDDLCQAAGVTKGAFFHHFRSKEELAVAAAGHFGEMAEGLFSAAPFRTLPDPRARVLAYIDFRGSILGDDLADFTCLLGTLVQETYASHPAIRAACEREIVGHATTLEPDIAAALAAAGRDPGAARGLAIYIQTVLQGAFILAKATGGPDTAAESLGHLRTHLAFLFDTDSKREILQ